MKNFFTKHVGGIAVSGLLILLASLLYAVCQLDASENLDRKHYREEKIKKANEAGKALCKPHGGVQYMYEDMGFGHWTINAKCKDGAVFEGLNNIMETKN